MAKEIHLQKKKTVWIEIGIIFLVVILLLIAFLLWFKKKYKINRDTDVKVRIIGMSGRYTEEEIRDYTLDKWYENYWILVKWYYKYKKVEPLPYLEKITVDVAEDGIIEISAYEKMPIGCIMEMGYYLYFDADGVIVSTKMENVEKLPVITGLKYTSVKLYEPFQTQKSNLFRVVMNIVMQLQKYEVTAEEIHFGQEDEVYLLCDGNRFDLGTRDAYDVQIGMIKGILDQVGGRELKYHFHMENVENATDDVHATLIERQPVE